MPQFGNRSSSAGGGAWTTPASPVLTTPFQAPAIQATSPIAWTADNTTATTATVTATATVYLRAGTVLPTTLGGFYPGAGFLGAAEGSAAPFGAPTGLIATTVSSTRIDLVWQAVTRAAAYDIERDGSVVATGVTGTSYSDTSLTSSTLYSYRVRAVSY